jgi:hypothetical protein
MLEEPFIQLLTRVSRFLFFAGGFLSRSSVVLSRQASHFLDAWTP